MEAYCAFGNREAQPDPTSLPATSIVQTVERLKQFFQRICGNAIAAIGHPNHGFLTADAFPLLQMDLNRRAFAGVADSVAHHVLDRTVQQGCISVHCPVSWWDFAVYVAATRLRFELRVF